MRLSDLLPKEGVFGEYDPSLITVSGVCTHTEKLQKGMLFIAKRGARTDATKLLDKIEEKGAGALLLEENTTLCRETKIPCFYAKNITLTEAKIWERYYGDPAKNLRIFGVTGTNGKTSTAEFLTHIFNTAGIPTAYIGTLGTRFKDTVIASGDTMTTPPAEALYRTLRELVDLGARALVMEVSSHAASQGRVALLNFESLLFTNLTEDHLDYHGSMENYFIAKRSLFAQAKLAIINKDDDYGQRLLAEFPVKRSIAVIEDADYTVSDLHENGYESTQYSCVSPSGVFSVSYPFFGSFHVYNTLLATAAALSAGACFEDVRRALSTLKAPKGRLEVLPLNKEYTVIIDYAHTPDAMACAIKSVRRLTRGRLFVVFGAGGEREREKQPQMGHIAVSLATHVFLTEDNPRGEAQAQIFSDILLGIKNNDNYSVIENRADAIRTALDSLVDGDTLLLLGKGHEEYLLIGEEKRFFSEREIVYEHLKEKERG